jgi:hypothetical protein
MRKEMEGKSKKEILTRKYKKKIMNNNNLSSMRSKILSVTFITFTDISQALRTGPGTWKVLICGMSE